jgi:thiosulfate/3-mercaptopyruvate sulfurtransferase
MMTGDSNLISGQELLSRIGDPNLRIVDCRFDLADPGAGRWAYQNGHIPGAVFADLDMDLSAPVTGESGRHPLPATKWLLKWLGHDRVRLLDGGIDHWVASARAVRKGDEQASSRSFVARPCNDRVLTTAELAGDLDGTARLRLIDARDAARFRGEVEPIDPVAGHIPGSLNLPYSVSLNDDGTWKARAALEAIWLAVLGEDRSAPWSAMCGSGVTACHLAISATEAGFEEPRLYVGSWSEWIRDPGRPVGLGEGPNRRPGAADMA